MTLGFLLLSPLIVLSLSAGGRRPEVSALCYIGPSALSFVLGAGLWGVGRKGRLDGRGAILVCALAWIALSAMGALPFCFALGMGYLDAFFETVSGFTTTGITMLAGLDVMPRSILFWRSFIQWLGGLGILAFFLTVVSAGPSDHRLFAAESHKVFGRRPAPSIFRTLRILWCIYAGLTALTALALIVWGMGVFDAVCHAFTSLSTGGYSPHDASIAYYRQVGFEHYVAIEYTLIVAMVLGGTNFFIHYRLVCGELKALWDNLEVKLWWGILAGATALVMLDHSLRQGLGDAGQTFRDSLFQVVAIGTTTGYATRDIGSPYFPALARQVFLVLMVIGGCVGSTGGGIKVLRVGVLFKMIARQVRRVNRPPSVVSLLAVDGEVLDPEEVRRVAGLFFAWVVLLVLGGGISAFLSELGPLDAASGMFSALGNIGPSYIPVRQMAQLHPIIKLTYIAGMLAGRLEVLPILVLFSRRTWR